MIYDNDAPPEEIWHAGRVEFALRYPFSNGWRTVAGGGSLATVAFLVLSAVPAVAVFFSLTHFLPSFFRRPSSPSLGALGGRSLRGVGVVFVAGVVLTSVGFVTADIASFYGGSAGDEAVAVIVALGAVVGFFFWLGYAPVSLAVYWGRVYKEVRDVDVVEPEDTSV